MKVSELSEYKDKTEKTGVRVGDYVSRGVDAVKYIIAYIGGNQYTAVNLNTGFTWNHKAIFQGARDRIFTKSELEQILGDLETWEVVE